MPAGLAIFASGEALNHYSNAITLDDISRLNGNIINRFDKPAINYLSAKHSEFSDYSRAALVLSPSIIMLHQSKNFRFKNSFTLGIIYLESMLCLKGLNDIVKNLTARPRPFLYNPDLSVQERYDYLETTSSYGSFFSGHTSTAFLSAVFLSKTFTDIYGKSAWNAVIWTASLSAASITGYCRVAAGEHFPTDVLTGAIIGSLFGYIFPIIHNNQNKNIQTTFTLNTCKITYSF